MGVTGDMVACFLVPWITDAATFADVRILAEEHGVLVDRTILAPGDPAPQFATRQVCARVSALTTFALALRDSTPPVIAVNHAPVAAAQAVSTGEDTAIAIVVTAFDADGDTLTYRVLTGPAHGTLGGTAPTVTYTPATNFNGTDSFTYQAADPSGAESNLASVTVTVTAVNDAPVAAAQAVTLADDDGDATKITLTASDVDGDRLTYRIVTPPAHGRLSGTLPKVTYKPAEHYEGSDSFTFTANDGTVDSAPATVTITPRPSKRHKG